MPKKVKNGQPIEETAGRRERSLSLRGENPGDAAEIDQEPEYVDVGDLEESRARVRDQNLDLLLKAFRQYLSEKEHLENESPAKGTIHYKKITH